VSSGGEYSILSVLAESQRHKRIRNGAYHFKELVGCSSPQRSRKVILQRTVARDLTIRFDCIRTKIGWLMPANRSGKSYGCRWTTPSTPCRQAQSRRHCAWLVRPQFSRSVYCGMQSDRSTAASQSTDQVARQVSIGYVNDSSISYSKARGLLNP
jgi:hypothetical protein